MSPSTSSFSYAPRICFLTTNIGSLCEEDPDEDIPKFMNRWIKYCNCIIEKEKPDFLIIGLQEVGGKEKKIQNVDRFCTTFYEQVVEKDTATNSKDKKEEEQQEQEEQNCTTTATTKTTTKNSKWWSYGLVYNQDIHGDEFTALGCIYLIRRKWILDNTPPLLPSSLSSQGGEEESGAIVPLAAVQMYNFRTNKYDSVLSIPSNSSRTTTSINCKDCPYTIHKKLNQAEKSRKGFLLARLRFHSSSSGKSMDDEIDIINLHLYHDASNIIAMSNPEPPSVYASKRNHALQAVMEQVKNITTCSNNDNDDDGACGSSNNNNHHRYRPAFYFGDFNFRLHLHDVVKYYQKQCSVSVVDKEAKSDRSLYKIDKKQFLLLPPSNNNSDDGIHKTFFGKDLFDDDRSHYHKIKSSDVELQLFNNDHENDHESQTEKDKADVPLQLYEQMISFPPTYPIFDDNDCDTHYSSTDHQFYAPSRCPAWCDRILYNDSAAKRYFGSATNRRETDNSSITSTINKRQKQSKVANNIKYDPILPDSTYGDHHAVYLAFSPR